MISLIFLFSCNDDGDEMDNNLNSQLEFTIDGETYKNVTEVYYEYGAELLTSCDLWKVSCNVKSEDTDRITSFEIFIFLGEETEVQQIEYVQEEEVCQIISRIDINMLLECFDENSNNPVPVVVSTRDRNDVKVTLTNTSNTMSGFFTGTMENEFFWVTQCQDDIRAINGFFNDAVER